MPQDARRPLIKGQPRDPPLKSKRSQGDATTANLQNDYFITELQRTYGDRISQEDLNKFFYQDLNDPSINKNEMDVSAHEPTYIGFPIPGESPEREAERKRQLQQRRRTFQRLMEEYYSERGGGLGGGDGSR